MSAITKESVAGTLESSDAMVYASPNPGGGRLISINSSVGQQFAPQIKASAEAVLNRLNIEDVALQIEDKGALDCVLQARESRFAARRCRSRLGGFAMKLRRSMLFVPGANAAMVSTSFIYQPDTIMFDLEELGWLCRKKTAPACWWRMLCNTRFTAKWKRWCASTRSLPNTAWQI